MSIIVVYNSNTGFTKQYAEWIAESLVCETMSLKDATSEKLRKYDVVIFGGWILGNIIVGLEKFEKLEVTKRVIYAVGAAKASTEVMTTIRETNTLLELPFFYFQGGFHYKKLNFMYRAMLKMVKASVSKKQEKTELDKFMERVLGTSFDSTDKNAIAPLVAYIEKKEA